MSGKFISIPGALLVIICFFLPWLTVSCNGQELGQVSGQELALGSDVVDLSDDLRLIDLDAVGGDIAWLVIPLSGLVGLLLGIVAFLNKENERGAGVGSLIFGILGFTVFILEYFLLQQSSSIPGITIQTAYGLWGSIAGLLLLVIGGVLMLILGGGTNTAVSPAAAYAATPPPVSTGPNPAFNPPNQSGNYGFGQPPNTAPFGGSQPLPTVQGTPDSFGQPSGGQETLLSDNPFASEDAGPLQTDLPTAPFQGGYSPPAPPQSPAQSPLPPTIVGLPGNPNDEPTAAVPPENRPAAFPDIDSTIPEPPSTPAPPPPPAPPAFTNDAPTFVPPPVPPRGPNLNDPPPTIQAFPDPLPVEPVEPPTRPVADSASPFETIEDEPKQADDGAFSHLFDSDDTFAAMPATAAVNLDDLPDLSQFSKEEPPAFEAEAIEDSPPEPPAPPRFEEPASEPFAPADDFFAQHEAPDLPMAEPMPPQPLADFSLDASPPIAPSEPFASLPPVPETVVEPEPKPEPPASPPLPIEPEPEPTPPVSVAPPPIAPEPTPPAAPEPTPPVNVAPPPPPLEVAPPPPPVQPIEPPPTVIAPRQESPLDATVISTNPPSSSSPKTEILQRFSETFATLVVAEGANKGRQYRLSNLTSIGRDANNDVVINDTAMSGSHARVRQEGGTYFLYDLASTNGTYIYDKRTDKWDRVYREPLEEGKQIKLGRTVLSFAMVTQ